MRLHDVEEGVQYLEREVQRALASPISIEDRQRLLDYAPDSAIWGAVKRMMSDAVSFDFGSAIPSIAHIDFGADLFERGAFVLPYPVVAFCTKNIVYLAGAGDNGDLVIVRCSGTVGRRDGVRTPLPVFVARAELEEGRGCLVSSAPLIEIIGHDQDPWDTASDIIGAVLGLTALLMSKETKRTTLPAPTGLNKSRARKGKPAIREIISVRVSQAQRPAGSGGGSHKSPVMHWRRGHFRTLSDPRYGERRVIPVAPSLVGAADDVPVIAPKAYRVAS